MHTRPEESRDLSPHATGTPGCGTGRLSKTNNNSSWVSKSLPGMILIPPHTTKMLSAGRLYILRCGVPYNICVWSQSVIPFSSSRHTPSPPGPPHVQAIWCPSCCRLSCLWEDRRQSRRRRNKNEDRRYRSNQKIEGGMHRRCPRTNIFLEPSGPPKILANSAFSWSCALCPPPPLSQLRSSHHYPDTQEHSSSNRGGHVLIGF